MGTPEGNKFFAFWPEPMTISRDFSYGATNCNVIDCVNEQQEVHPHEENTEPALDGSNSNDVELVDYENNNVFLLLPEPEENDDDSGSDSECATGNWGPEDYEENDDDSDCATGNWGYPGSSSLVGGDYRTRDRSHDEHKKAMKKVDDEHFRNLITQLLQVENVPVTKESNEESWVNIITALCWKAVILYNPDSSMVGGMNPGEYVKVKCLASGYRSESVVVKGIVCKKDVAHRLMISDIDKPRLLLLGGSLQYQAVANHLSSFHTFFQQEMDPLKMALAKIDAHHPDALLVEKSVSQYAREYLLEKDISLVHNIKRPLLERIARCAGAEIVPSLDHLMTPKLGYCNSFHVEKILEDHGSAGQSGKKLTKTLMFFEGLPKPLGCTILLKGASADELKKVKHVVQHGVLVAYHLFLETSFFANEVQGDDDKVSSYFANLKDMGQHVSCPHADGAELTSHSGTSDLASSELRKINCNVEMESLKEETLPLSPDHHSILVSLSTCCMWKGTVCQRDIFRITYYGSFDKPLHRFLRDHLFDQGYRCLSCEFPSEAHVRCYTHQQGNLKISVKKHSEFLLPGVQKGKIWTWHRCLRCPRINGFPPATKRVVMTDAALRLSFGNFLALSFGKHDAASRVASCGHSLYTECLRFYGFGRMVACFQYAPINVYSVYLPPVNIDFNYNKQEWIQKEADVVSSRAEFLFAEVLNALHHISEKNSSDFGAKSPVSSQHIAELKVMLQKEKEEFEELLSQVLDREPEDGQPAVDILKINRLMRQLIFHSYVWDQRLLHVTSSTHNYLSTNMSNQSDNLEYGEAVQQALSQDNTAACSDPHPGGFSTGMRSATEFLGVLNCTNNQSLAEEPHPLSSALPTKGLNDINNSSGWVRISFPTLYSSFDENLSTNLLKLGKISEYNPVYISWSHSSSAGLLLPVASPNTIVPIYDDEPTSIISYALVSPDYLNLMSDEPKKQKAASESKDSFSRSLSGLDSLLDRNALHAKLSFSNDCHPGKVEYTVTCYFAKQFKALRETCCPRELDFIRSISRCKMWGSQGGKSNEFLDKTLDDRFIVKQITKTDLISFIKFAPAYFNYLSESINTGNPSCLAKILGIYQVTWKHLKEGKESRMEILVMENLFFKRNITRLYDLKGSSRSRYNPDSDGSNKILLDQNLIEAMATSPIFVGTEAKRLLERAVWNDTSFLASINMTDYSLLVGVDEEKNELVIGIINFMRQYTWNKHLETWIRKALCMSPTVICPVQYRKRFRRAISFYFRTVPDQ